MTWDWVDALLWLVWAYGCGIVFASAAIWRIDRYYDKRRPKMPPMLRRWRS